LPKRGSRCSPRLRVCSPTPQGKAATAQVQRRKWKLLMSRFRRRIPCNTVHSVSNTKLEQEFMRHGPRETDNWPRLSHHHFCATSGPIHNPLALSPAIIFTAQYHFQIAAYSKGFRIQAREYRIRRIPVSRLGLRLCFALFESSYQIFPSSLPLTILYSAPTALSLVAE
jgi:hypothetical protein